MTTAEIRADSYHAEVMLDVLPNLPITNIRKLFQLMFRCSWENCETIQTIGDWLQEEIREAGIEWHFASAEYEHKHVSLPGYTIPNAESIKAISKLSTNRPLLSAVKNAKTRYERLMKIQLIFNETKEKYYV
ncbi:hypothetical protein [Clostridium sp. KNHs216]|uniref:hypothetical protein n=1 Tax=Clostridium sp. KNHs216 TaxID=1550235 RepID=UPI00114DBA9B|nr:hypothetical protein [Clostridium sp. KNHs216]TQI66237.1 hypothetical protein LY85_0898 [Clostridium sp. KNHs216]